MNETHHQQVVSALLEGYKILRFEESWGLDWNPEGGIELGLPPEPESIDLYDKFSRLSNEDQLLAWAVFKYSTWFFEEIVDDPGARGEMFLDDPEVYFLQNLRDTFNEKTVDHMLPYFDLTTYAQHTLANTNDWCEITKLRYGKGGPGQGYVKVH